MIVCTLATALVLGLWVMGRGPKVRPLDRDDLVRFQRHSDEKCRDWMYPFE